MMKGIKAEKKVANSLRRAGGKVEQSPGSRGSADIVAKLPNKTWFVQVKSSLKKEPANLTTREKLNITKRAENNNGTPVLAQVSQGKITYTSVKSGRKLNP